MTVTDARPHRHTRPTPLDADDVATMDVEHLIVFSYVTWAAAARRRVTLRQLADLRGKHGRPLGPRVSASLLRDLVDQGLVHLPGLAIASPTDKLAVLVCGYLPPMPGAPRPVHTPLGADS